MRRLGFAILIVLAWAAPAARAGSLIVSDAPPPETAPPPLEKPDQLPQSRVARGSRDIAAAWLAAPTRRYVHGVIGDDLEAGSLRVETRAGQVLSFDLPDSRVFEDLEPRLADLDGDGRDEIVVVETDVRLGASLAVFSVDGATIRRRAATAFLGQPNRWLNPVGIGDFDGDGRPDIAVVATPHIGGVLRLYRWSEPRLTQFAEMAGVTNHFIGSAELGLARVVPGKPRDRILIPDQKRTALVLLEWRGDGLVVEQRVALPGSLSSSLVPVGEGRWRARLENGRWIEISVR
ncbi:MAG: VCBS repeat-containing protein [Betaproteobacteria bacterium]|nr:VCBS repeat-containing protein [Betaproteobacteria bacterium]